MSLDDQLNEINQQIENYYEQQTSIDRQEMLIEARITSLRLELAKLKDNRFKVKQEQRKAVLSKESIERKIELEKEAAIIQKTLEEKRAVADKILATAPWRDVAFDWQIDGALKLPERAILADKRGLGKTLSSIIWRRLQGVKRTLVCLRKEVASDFMKELGIREPGLLVYPLLGASATERQIAATLLNHHEEFVVVTNIESWRRNIDQTTKDILRISYDGVILDEAHHIKNSSTGTAQGFFRLAENIPKVLELTGTPIKNRPQEMYSLLHAVYPYLFPSERKFLSDYCTPVGQNKYIFSQQGLVNLVNKISSFYLARSPEDVGRNVPPPRIIEYELDFSNHPSQGQAYRDMTERSLAVLDTGKVVPIVSQLAVMTRQAQIVTWPADIEFKIRNPETNEVEDIVRFDIHESVKIDWAVDLIKELVDEGERVILFSRFKPPIYELRKRLSDLSVAVITGDEKTKGNTEEVFNDFDLKTAPKDPKYSVLLATYQTVGESANLNAATHMILLDRFWNPGNEDQAIGRVDRINSKKQATVHVPVVRPSIDEYMAELIEGKRNIVMEFKDAASMQANLVEHLKKTI